MRLRLLLFATGVLAAACSPISRKAMTRTIKEEENKLQNHIGLLIVDPSKNKTLLEYQSEQYFTPASNTKVLTLYTCLNVLGDSLPSIKYVERGDSLVFWGMGDPSFLNENLYDNQRVYSFFQKSNRTLYFSTSNFATEHFGRGWAWDDYTDYYSAERSSFPVYGNTFRFYPLPDQTLIVPSYFKKFYKRGTPQKDPKVIRSLAGNEFVYHPAQNRRYKDFTVPFRVAPALVADLLADTLHRPVKLSSRKLSGSERILYSVPSDSIYAVMMKESDNHVAEQLLLMCSAVLSDSLHPEPAIRHMLRGKFAKYSNKPKWVDGSGLSRYNLVTPRFMVQLWQDMLATVPRERLFPLLATGGENGTLKNYFKSPRPYIFGKTGTLSNNHSLSGFLVTKKGTLLVFAYMNANFVAPVREVRADMERILNLYYENY